MRNGARSRLRPARFFVGLFIIVALLELGAQAVESRTPDALRWYDASTQIRVEQMNDMAGADVVFAGTSMAWQGFVPAVWTGVDPLGRTAFNVGLAGGVPEVMEPWLLDVVEPKLGPDLVVWGLTSMDFSASYGSDNVARYADALDARGGTLADIEQTLARYSALVRFRNVMRDPGQWGSDRGFPAAAATLGAAGERTDFVRDLSADRRDQVATRLIDFKLDEADIAALHRTVVTLRERGTEVVLVQMPVPQRYVSLHPNGRADVTAAHEAIDRLGKALDVQVYDAGSGFDDLDFVDFTHLDAAAAADFTTRVATLVTGAQQDSDTTDTIDSSELARIATYAIAVNDNVRSALTQTGNLPASSELWTGSIEYGHTRDLTVYASNGQRFNTLFAGSSMVYAAFEPLVYTELTGLSSYNIALPSAGPEETAAYLQDVALAAARPERVVLGIALRDFVSQGDGADCIDPLTKYNRSRGIREAAFAPVNDLAQFSNDELLFGIPLEHEPTRLTPLHERYRNNFSLLGDRSKIPTQTKKQLRTAAATLTERAARYEFCQGRMDALDELVADLAAQGIDVVVVAVPVSSFRVDPLPGGRDQLRDILSSAADTALTAGASQFIDLSDLLEDDQFYDYTHADAQAADEFTRAFVDALEG